VRRLAIINSYDAAREACVPMVIEFHLPDGSSGKRLTGT
jgi:hypothetical protein